MKEGKLSYTFYTVFHPIQGFEAIKWYKKGSYQASIIILLALFLYNVVERQATGFIFNGNNLEKINVLSIFFITIVTFLLWFVSNWALCTLMNGEGRPRDIWIASSYALIPYIVINLGLVILSNFVSAEAGVFLTMAQYAAVGWSIILMLIGMYIVHQYTLKQTIANLILTVVGIAVIAFLMILVFSLFQQLFVFILTIYNEIMFRL